MRTDFRKRRGFTLVELMVATTIMIILIMFVTNIAVSMLRAYDNTVAALTANSDARSVLDPLESDLTSAMSFDDSHCWFEVRYDGENELGNLESHAAPQIMLFSQTSDRTRRSRTGSSTTELPGELCAVRYCLVQKSPFGDAANSPENLSYIVYRAVLNAKDTLESAVPYVVGASGKSGGDIAKQKPSEFWDSAEQITDPSDEKKYSPREWAKQIQNFLIDGVVDITLVFWSMISPTANAKSPSSAIRISPPASAISTRITTSRPSAIRSAPEQARLSSTTISPAPNPAFSAPSTSR
jgi:prepilin-type N-terminal cleavage/methylation domain-containing protein